MNNDPMKRLQKMMQVSYDGEERAEDYAEEVEQGGNGNLVQSIIRDFGGFSIAMGAVKTATSCATKLFPNNNKYQKIAQFAEGAMPVMMTGHKVLQSISKYMESKRRMESNDIDEEAYILASILGCQDDEDLSAKRMDYEYGNVETRSVTDEWLMTCPNTEILTTAAVFDRDFKSISQSDAEQSFLAYYVYRIHIDEGDDITFVLKIGRTIFGKLSSKRTYFDGQYYSKAIRALATYAYLDSLNMKENVIVMRGAEDIDTVPKKIVEHEVYQLDGSLFGEIKNSIKKKKKRGYALVGSPGTGKTTVVDKIIDNLRDVRVISIQMDSMCNNPSDMMDCLIMCQMIAPCMVIFEDIDSLPLKQKHSPWLQALIEYMDSAKYDAPIIFLATMNEPENIHESLMDRRGRFDRLIMVNPPESRQEIDDVFGNIYRREIGSEPPAGIISDEFCQLVAENDIRHSDFTEAINRVVINCMPLEPESFTESLRGICNTQYLVNRFKNRNAVEMKGVVSSGSLSDCGDEGMSKEEILLEDVVDVPMTNMKGQAHPLGKDICGGRSQMDHGCQGIGVGIGEGI